MSAIFWKRLKMKMSEKQFEIALFLQGGKESKGTNAAREVLVNGLSQVEAARLCGVSRQMVFSASDRIVQNYLKALRIKEAFEMATADGTEPTQLQKYEIQELVSIKGNSESPARKAGHDVMVLGVPVVAAAATYKITYQTLQQAVSRAEERYEKGKTIKKMFDDILEA